MNVTQAFFLALVQGLTEFLPVSSSGHLVLFERWFGVTGDSFTFILLVHVASALAIILFFAQRLLELTKKLWLPVLVGTVPAVLTGLFFKDYLESLFAGETLLAGGFLITALVNLGIHILLQRSKKKELEAISAVKKSGTKGLPDLDGETISNGVKTSDAYEASPEHITWWQASVVGVAQAIAIIPSISRSGSTVVAGLAVGLSRKAAFDFSFLLALPAIGGATLLHLVDGISATGNLPTDIFTVPNMLGFFVSFIVSYLSLGLLRFMMKEAQFSWFVVYCLGAAVVSFFFY